MPRGGSKPKHGMYATPTYYSWQHMKRRCTDTKFHQYPKYGGRGIAVCERWLVFENFLADMGVRPLGTTLDRKDGSKGYEPGNCRWATPREQRLNTSNARWVEYEGRRMVLADWAAELGVSYECLARRLYVMQWSVEKAFTTPVRKRSAKTYKA